MVHGVIRRKRIAHRLAIINVTHYITEEFMPRQYVIFDSRPAYCYGGGHHFNAYPTFNRPWTKIRELLPPDVCNYALFDSESKPQAIKEAKRRWKEGDTHASS